MKNTSQRDALFLAEMGIGPLWQLRAAPHMQADADAEPELAVTEAAP